MSGHCFVLSLSTNLHQVWRQPFTRLVVTDWFAVELMCGQRNSQGSRRQGSEEKTQEDQPQCAVVYFLPPPCSIVFEASSLATSCLIGAAVAGASLLTASSMSSVSIPSVSTPPACAAVDVETRLGAAGSGGAGCPSWALASTGPSSPPHRSSNRARHRSVCC